MLEHLVEVLEWMVVGQEWKALVLVRLVVMEVMVEVLGLMALVQMVVMVVVPLIQAMRSVGRVDVMGLFAGLSRVDWESVEGDSKSIALVLGQVLDQLALVQALEDILDYFVVVIAFLFYIYLMFIIF